MQVQNPDYKFHKMLAGNWRNANGSCTAVFSEHGNIEISYAGACFSRGYGITQLGPVVGIVGAASMNAMGMMGIGMMGVGMMGMQRHEGESLRFSIDGLCLTNGNEDVFRIDCAWYADRDAQFHIELTDLRSGQKWHHVLTRDAEAGAAKALSDDAFTCKCGYRGPARKFCPECGRAVERHTCECGCVSIGAKFCPNCGKPIQKEAQEKKVLEKKELLFAISMSMSTNPPRTDGAQVYAYSDTELVLEHGTKQRLISADVLEPAYEIIRKNKLDDPDFTDPVGGAIMGGTANVGFKNGDQWINASMYDKGNAALSAYYELMGLFQNA